MGLRIMNYRANLIDATVDIKPGEPDGTVVMCRVPISQKK
jgi:signal transduction histidine kinase